MRDKLAIRSLFFPLAAATFILQPFSAVCSESNPAMSEKDAKQKSAQKTPVSNLPKLSLSSQPEGAPKALTTPPAPSTAKEHDSKKTPPVPAEKQPLEKAAEDNPKQPAPLSIPFIEGYDSLDLKIPDFDASTGALKSFFSIGALRRLDDKHVEIRQSFLGLYKADGSVDLSVDVTKASLDRFTRKLSSRVPVIIWSDKFQVTGSTMELDTVSKEAKLGGPVRVLIYKGERDADDGLDATGPAGETVTSEAKSQGSRSPDSSGAKEDKIK
jgi:hypothetical protein